jgi:DNA modification methylase
MSGTGTLALPANRIVHGNALTVLKTLPDNSIDACITSPPYWKQRDYGDETETVWDANPNCQHEWSAEATVKCQQQQATYNERCGVAGGEGRRLVQGAISEHRKISRGRFCQKCPAWKGMLGQERTPESYVRHLTEIFREVKRVLKPWGTLWVVIDDTHASGKGTCGNPGGGERSFQAHADRKQAGAYPLDRWNISDLKEAGLKPGDLVGVPSMLAFALRRDGFYWHSDVIWAKSLSFCPTYSGTVMPESVKNRPTDSYEHVLLFSKTGRTQYWVNRKTCQLVSKHPPGTKGIEAADWEWADCPRCSPQVGETKIEAENAESFGSPRARYHRHQDREQCRQCGGTGKVKRSLWRSHNYYYDQDAEREPLRSSTIERGKYGRKTSKHLNHPAHAGAGRSFQNAINDGKTDAEVGFAPAEGRNLRSVWTINPEASKMQHFATFPKALVRPMIRLSCPEHVCRKCGMPRERILEAKTVKRTELPADHPDYRPNYYNEGKAGDPQTHGTGQRLRLSRTIGWSDCGCGAGFRPGVVLDPFIGSGTVATVAKQLGRSYIGVELNGEYVRIAEERVRSAEVEIRSLEAYLPA